MRLGGGDGTAISSLVTTNIVLHTWSGELADTRFFRNTVYLFSVREKQAFACFGSRTPKRPFGDRRAGLNCSAPLTGVRHSL